VTRPPSGRPEDRAERDPRRRLVTPVDLVDVFVYVVVLNLAIEYVPSVISETFTISLLTAVLLKLVLELVVVVKGRVLGRVRGGSTRTGKVVGAVSLWLVAVGSKFLVLELVDLVFRGSVELGGFIQVTLLILTLLACRGLVRRFLVPGSAFV
jgi:hypothetical protein